MMKRHVRPEGELRPEYDAAHLYKSRLQNYALKNNLKFPAYSCEYEGPAHALRFKCSVTFQEKTVETSEFYPTLKEAENAAAKRAWESWSLNEAQQDDTARFKNLLHEFLQKKGWPAPKYEITSSGPSHRPLYVAKVNIQGEVYEGEAALVKKQAQSYSAKVAYLSLLYQKQKRELAEEKKVVYCEEHKDRQPAVTSDSCIKEAMEVSSSILLPVIAGDVSPKATPNSNLLVPAEHPVESVASNGHAPPYQVNGVAINTSNAEVEAADTMTKGTVVVRPRYQI